MGKRARRCVLLAAVGAVALVAVACGPNPPPTPNADYQFYAFERQYPLSCAATSGPPLAPVGAGEFSFHVVEQVDGVREHVAQFSTGGGFSLAPTTSEFPNNSYSIVMLFRLSEIGGFDRLLDFKSGTSDDGVYLVAGSLLFHRRSALGSKVIANNEYAQVVVTRAADGTTRGFVDGAQQWQFADTTGDGLISSANELIFFRDNTSGGFTTEHSAGAVARIRVFDRPLSQTEINNLGQTPGSPCT
jgi:hypothetical protein